MANEGGPGDTTSRGEMQPLSAPSEPKQNEHHKGASEVSGFWHFVAVAEKVRYTNDVLRV